MHVLSLSHLRLENCKRDMILLGNTHRHRFSTLQLQHQQRRVLHSPDLLAEVVVICLSYWSTVICAEVSDVKARKSCRKQGQQRLFIIIISVCVSLIHSHLPTNHSISLSWPVKSFLALISFLSHALLSKERERRQAVVPQLRQGMIQQR